MSGAESYRVFASLGLNVQESMAPIKELVAGLRQVLRAQREIQAAQVEITKALQTSTSAARAFADQMERAARAAKGMAGMGAAGGGGSVVPGGGGGSGYAGGGGGGSQPRMLSGPPLLLGATTSPGTGFTMSGAPYGPTPNFPRIGSNPSAGTGFTMGGTPPQGNAPFFAPGAAPRITLNPVPAPVNYYALGYGAQYLGRAAGSMVDQSFMEAAGVDQLKGALRTQGFTQEQTDAAYSAAVKTQQSVSGSYIGQNLGLIVQLMKQTQNADEAIALLPETARAQAVFKGLGRGDGMDDVSSMLNAAELRSTILKTGPDGKETLNQPAYRQFTKNLETITAMSGGQIGPEQIYQFMRSGGIAAKMLSDSNGFAEYMPFIQSMGAAQAGTALQGFSRQFSGGRMSQGAFNMLSDMGVIKDKSKADKAGIDAYILKPGAMASGDLELIRSNPAKFIIDRILPAVDAYLSKNYGATFTGADQQTRAGYEFGMMQTVASLVTGGKEMAQAVSLNPYMKRDILAQQRLQNNDPYKTAVDSNPLMALETFRSSINAFMVTLGQDNMQVSVATMHALTIALNALSNVFAANKNLGADMMLVADALKIMAPAIAAIAIAVPAVAAGKNIMGSLAGTAASTMVVNASTVLLKFGVAKFIADLVDPNDGFSKWVDRHVPGAGAIDRWVYTHTGGTDAQFNDARGLPPIVIQNTTTLDGKVVAQSVTKHIINGANGPATGTGTFDPRRTMTQPGNN